MEEVGQDPVGGQGGLCIRFKPCGQLGLVFFHCIALPEQRGHCHSHKHTHTFPHLGEDRPLKPTITAELADVHDVCIFSADACDPRTIRSVGSPALYQESLQRCSRCEAVQKKARKFN